MLSIFGKLCNKLKNILNDYDESSSNFKLSFKGKYCDLLNYWLYDELIQTNLDSNIIRSFYSILKFIVIIFYKEKCFLHDFKADKVVLQKRKKSFEFFEHYDVIKDTLSIETATKNNKYCNYKRDSFLLYKDMEDESNSKRVRWLKIYYVFKKYLRVVSYTI